MSEPQTLLAGPLFVGVVLNWALFGALVIQLYDYHSYFRTRDRLIVKILVHWVSTVEVVQTVFITHTAWWVLVRNWGISDGLPWTGTYIPILNGLASASVQAFYAWRIWQFEIRFLDMFGIKYAVKMSAVVIVLTALTQFAAGIWVAIEFIRASRNIADIALIRAPAETWLIGSFVCDLLIAVVMVFLLMSVRRGSNNKRTMLMINNLIVNTVETGAITAVLALTELILYETSPNTYMHIAVEFVLGRLYCNVLLAALNGRARETDRVPDRKLGNITSVNFQPGGTELTAGPINFNRAGGHSADDSLSGPTNVATASDSDGGTTKKSYSLW
ncbi:hypothetical protein MSAN_01148500 [Mycena sanguinolenta]|uniref:DUF6534 domain-containing protein n=1 Tax=Mycena sanguinolenta TaxID=230812 RepID=A0A8H7D6H9_9AGAR|nr:hypothetical protein MSAN_01148500 [Mycena sanguinolenta]